MAVDPFDLIEQVHDEDTFMVFLRALHADWELSRKKVRRSPSSPYEPAARGWENTNIGSFLEAAIAWAEDMGEGNEFFQKPDNAWRRMAYILLAGKEYE